MTCRPTNRGLTYLRRSDVKQGLSLSTQLNWALGEAQRLGVSLLGDLNDLEYMQANHLVAWKSLRLDDAVTGGDLSRPGFQALIQEALNDRTISHIFFHKRDRFARPQEAFEAGFIEKKLSASGIWIVLSGKIVPPIQPGEGELSDDIAIMLDYYQSGQFLRTLSERIIATQRGLAEQGYWLGGRPPLGFIRILVDASGNELEELPDRRHVEDPGCHVRIKPKDQAKLAIWLLILELKFKGWGGKKIAHHLNKMGIPSPDAGRRRSDHGVPHYVTGKWSVNTVLDLCRNPAIIGVLEQIRRSEGTYRRHAESGWRSLTDGDRAEDKKRPKMISNPADVRIKADAGFEALYDRERWAEIQQELDRRSASQRGIPRAKDPAKYPFACRVIDMTDGCGSVMYGRTSGKRAMYTCGRYMRTAGAECENNQVDAEALHRMALSWLRQFAALGTRRNQIVDLLKKRAAEAAAAKQEDVAAVDELARLRRARHQLSEKRDTVGRRMACEPNDDLCKIMRSEFERLTAELSTIDRDIDRLTQKNERSVDPQTDVNAALRILERLEQVVEKPEAREAFRELAARLGMRVGLTFDSALKGKVRRVRRLVGGLIVFGDRELPVPLHGRDRLSPDGAESPPAQSEQNNGERVRENNESSGVETVGADPTGSAPTEDQQNESHREGVSFTKVSRGDRIRTCDIQLPKLAL